MHVIAGRLGGRAFDSPGTFKTHPMSDKIRGALFNILGDISGLTVLDPFGGSGALSFEAVSRGAARAVIVESDRAAQKAIESNIKQLGLQASVSLVAASASAWLATASPRQFDLVLCDPPYNDLQPNLLARLADLTANEGVFVLSFPGDAQPPAFAGMRQVLSRTYGDAQLIAYTPARD